MSSEPEPVDPQQAPQGARSGSVHWLVRIAETSGAGAGRRSTSSGRGLAPPRPGARSPGPTALSDRRLAELVAEYFRLKVAALRLGRSQRRAPDPGDDGAASTTSSPWPRDDRQLAVATCDPTDVEAERALGFSTGRTPMFEVASPQAIQDAIDGRFSPEKAVESLLGTLEADMNVDRTRCVSSRRWAPRPSRRTTSRLPRW